MPNIGAPELIIILIIALIVLGPGKLPDVASSLGKSVREFRKAASDISESTRLDAPASPAPGAPTPASPPTTTPQTPTAAPNTISGEAAPNTLQGSDASPVARSDDTTPPAA